MVGEANNAVAAGFERGGSALVVGRAALEVVGFAVDLDDKLLALADEVHHIGADG